MAFPGVGESRVGGAAWHVVVAEEGSQVGEHGPVGDEDSLVEEEGRHRAEQDVPAGEGNPAGEGSLAGAGTCQTDRAGAGEERKHPCRATWGEEGVPT